ncbi:hypothetical protein vseg_018010 [Gypsophila vaccaria]
MEEQFILRVPPSVAERIERLLNEDPSSSSEDSTLDLSFCEDGRSGTFMIGNDRFSASLLDLPTITESYKTYDDSVLIKTADIGQMILVREGNDNQPDMVESRHGLTPPMRDVRRRRFRREPDLNPEVVHRVETDLLKIMQSRDATRHPLKRKMARIMLEGWARRLPLPLNPKLTCPILPAMLGKKMEAILRTPMTRVSPIFTGCHLRCQFIRSSGNVTH